jgi:ABC-type branched-subunit amino acid transport system substrate-binding protein
MAIMKRFVIPLCAVIVLGLLSCAGPTPEPGKANDLRPAIFEVPPETATALARIEAANAYQTPPLTLRKDENYARTSEDVQPFGQIKPAKEHFLLQMEYTGAGRATPEPQEVNAVKIGFIGPITSTVSIATGGKSHEEVLGVKMLQGSRLAIEQANARGGYAKRHIPFELVVSNDNGLWGSSGNEIVKLAYKDEVWAILGTIDGANSHIAIRVGLKIEIPMMNTGDTDPTFIETNIPWVMRCMGDDRQMGYLLVDYMYRKMGYKRVGIIRASNRYGRFGVREINDGSRRLGRPVVLEMAYSLSTTDYTLQLERLKKENLDAIVHWGDAKEGAAILNQMRALGMQQPYLACDRCVSDEFAEIAGTNAEGVVCGFPWNPTGVDARLEQFHQDFRARFGEEGETYAAHAYDGMNLLIWAIEVAGLNRAKIRDVLATRTTPWKGVTGDIVFGACLDDIGDVYLAKYEGGKWVYYSRDDLKIPRGYIPPRDRINREPAAARADAPGPASAK